MHHFHAVTVGDADGDHDVGALGDRGEIRWCEPQRRAQRSRWLWRGTARSSLSGIQRCVVGTVASINMPMAISAALHDAMACTVCRWL